MKVEVLYMGKPEGYIDYPSDFNSEEDAEKCWDLCNWSCWAEEKPTELHSDLSFVSHGVCFRTPNGTNYLALSVGFLVGDDKKIADYINENKERIIWR